MPRLGPLRLGSLPTAGLDLSLLPASSRLDDNGFGARRSCAVVGASGSVLAARDGALIDAHQHVLRINRVRTRGFEAHVGSRTTLNLFWGHSTHLERWQAQQRALPPGARARGLVVPVKALDVSFFFEAAANLTRGGAAPPAPLLLVSERVYQKVVHPLPPLRAPCAVHRVLPGFVAHAVEHTSPPLDALTPAYTPLHEAAPGGRTPLPRHRQREGVGD